MKILLFKEYFALDSRTTEVTFVLKCSGDLKIFAVVEETALTYLHKILSEVDEVIERCSSFYMKYIIIQLIFFCNL